MSTVNERLGEENLRLQTKVVELQLCIACLIMKLGGTVTITEAEALAGAHVGVHNVPRLGSVDFVATPDENYTKALEQSKQEFK